MSLESKLLELARDKKGLPIVKVTIKPPDPNNKFIPITHTIYQFWKDDKFVYGQYFKDGEWFTNTRCSDDTSKALGKMMKLHFPDGNVSEYACDKEVVVSKNYSGSDEENKFTIEKAKELESRRYYKEIREKINKLNKAYLYHFGDNYPLIDNSKYPLIYFILSSKRTEYLADPLSLEGIRKKFVYEFEVTPKEISDFIFDFEYDAQDYEEGDDFFTMIIILPRSRFDKKYIAKYVPQYPKRWMEDVKLIKANFSERVNSIFGD